MDVFPIPPTPIRAMGDVFGQTDDLLDQLSASETGPRRRGRQFTKRARGRYEIMDLLVFQIADLVFI